VLSLPLVISLYLGRNLDSLALSTEIHWWSLKARLRRWFRPNCCSGELHRRAWFICWITYKTYYTWRSCSSVLWYRSDHGADRKLRLRTAGTWK
jgi:hypothetical protein